MDIKVAEWEKRNLGVETVEISLDIKDEIRDVIINLSSVNAEYIVVRVPSQAADLTREVQKLGFSYVEDMVFLSHDLKPVKRNPVEQRLYDAVTWDVMSAEEIFLTKEEIKKGLFASDRIYFDPFFTNEQAAQRYVNWFDDEIKRGSLPIKYVYKDEMVGFFVLKKHENNTYTSLLGGKYTSNKKNGIGSIIKVPEVVQHLGGKKVFTSVSTNNISQLRNSIVNGYVPESISHIFIKHN